MKKWYNEEYEFEIEVTGFKNIGAIMKKEEEKTNGKKYVFGFEESYGCLIGDYARDKDGIAAVMALCEAACYYKSKGETLWDQMNNIYKKYGYYEETQVSIVLEGAEGAEKIQEMMTDMRNTPVEKIGDYKVLMFEDIDRDYVKDMVTGEERTTGLPKSNVLYYELEDNNWCCVRPSGTEPKIKLYMGVKGASKEESNKKLPYWKDIQTVAVNKEYPRTAFMTYDNRDQALTGEYENSPYYKLLNGTWNFYYADTYKDLPANIEQPDANIAWKEIKVPGNWEVQGYGVAIYTNHGYEFKPRNPQPPQLPEANPVGVYQRDIEIPADWDGRDIFLRLEGAKSGVYVYVNGQEVGYSEDSKNPAEFLINNYLKPGKNSLVIKIFRWSTGSYLECQDFWRMSGIERDVFLFSQPKTHIKDFNVMSTLDDTYKNGIFKLDVDVTNHTAGNKEVTVAYELLDAAKKVVAEGNTPCPVTADGQKSISFEATLSNVKTWTSEHPNLYRLLISLKDGEKTSEIIPITY